MNGERPGGAPERPEAHAASEARDRVQLELAETQAIAQLGSWHVDLESGVVELSAEMRRLLGLQPSDGPLDPEAYAALVDPDDRERVLGELRALLRDGVELESEHRLELPDGTRRVVAVRARCDRDADGRVRRAYGTTQDITDRYLQERSVRDAEERFRHVFDDAPIGMVMTAPGGAVLRVNHALAALLGYTLDELAGVPLGGITHPEDRVADEDARQRLLAGDVRVDRRTKRFLLGGGRVVHARVSETLVCDDHGAPLYMLSQIEDETARVVAEQGLASAEARYRQARDVSLDAVWLLGAVRDADGEILDFEFVDANERALERAGRTAAELLGKRMAELFPVSVDEGFLDQYRDVLRHGGLLEQERSYVMDGQLRWTLQQVMPAGDGLLIASRDITDRKDGELQLRMAEERFRTAFEGASVGASLIGLDRRWIDVNQALCALLGREREELLGASFDSVTHPDDLDLGRDGVTALVRGEVESFVVEKRYLHRDGSIVWVRVSAAAVRDEEGRALYLVGHTEDITARRRAEADLREREAEQAALRDVATAVAAGEGPAAVFRLVAARVQELFSVPRAAITRFDGADVGTLLGVHPPVPPHFVEGMMLVLDGGTATGRVAATGAAAHAVRYRDQDIADHRLEPVGGVAGAAAPIRVAGRLWGALALASDDPVRVGPAAAERLERFAELVSLAIANAESLQRLIDEATTDALTRLANYRTFHERLRHEFERCRRYGRSLTLVLIDLDHFKELNDRHGHQVGDRTLATFADVLRGEAREGDTVARIGGEEFAWLMPEAGPACGLQAAERLRQAVQATAFPDAERVTVSLGACGAEDAANGLELVRLADHALYVAKHRGRNQCRRYTPGALDLRTA